jgi:hypothetical protein
LQECSNIWMKKDFCAHCQLECQGIHCLKSYEVILDLNSQQWQRNSTVPGHYEPEQAPSAVPQPWVYMSVTRSMGHSRQFFSHCTICYACFNVLRARTYLFVTPWSRGCPWSLALVVFFVPPWAPYFSTRGCILGKRAPRVSAGGDLILFAAELRALFPSFTVF